MKITLSQTELEKIIKDHLLMVKGFAINGDIEWNVTWDQQYDIGPTCVEISAYLLH